MGPKLNNPTGGPQYCSTSEGLQECVNKVTSALDKVSTAYGQNAPDESGTGPESDRYMPGSEAASNDNWSM